MNLHSFAVLVGGMLVFGMGMNAAQQLRVAATDMFPPQPAGAGAGLCRAGLAGGPGDQPVLISDAEIVRPAASARIRSALPWLLLPVLIVAGMLLVSFVRPDPKEIGMHLERYYPDYTPPPRSPRGDRAAFSALRLLRHGPTRLAIVSNCAAQGNMSIVMVLTSLVLAHHGHSLAAIAFSHMFHSAGMFAFTIPLGRLADRFGREHGHVSRAWRSRSSAPASSPSPATFWSVTLGTFLVGLGWAAANVAATALIADHAETRNAAGRSASTTASPARSPC